MSTRLATPAPITTTTSSSNHNDDDNDLGWEGWGWAMPSPSPTANIAIPRTVEGLCALPAAAVREGGAYARYYRRVVLGPSIANLWCWTLASR